MAITTQQRDKLVELYIAYFNRAPEAGGLTYWSTVLNDKLSAGQSEASAITDISNAFYAAGVQYSEQTGYSATMTDAAFVTKIYENVLGRTGSFAPTALEVSYWVTAINGTNSQETGVTRATVIQRMLSDAKEFAGHATWGWVAETLANKMEVANFYALQNISGNMSGPDAVLAGRAILQNVTADHSTVDAAIASLQSGGTFTLKEAIIEGEAGTPPVTAIYWGYTPDYSEVGEGYGIPVQALLDFVTTISGLDLHELGLIDDDGVGPFDNVTSLELEFETGNIDAAGNATLIIGFADGSSTSAEVALGEQYFNFLNNLLFDEDGMSRLYEKVVTPGEEETYDRLVPIVLTPIENNGGTVEYGNTGTGNDTIVAGRLDLLHRAYIDGGAGYNLLEIDAKGAFAQPLQLLNIQEVRVSDQPNFYSDGDIGGSYYNIEDGYLGDSDYPYPTGSGSDDSWLDLSRATKIQKLVVTDQGNGSGDLTIVGVRNGAELRLEGAFNSGDTTISYGQGLTGVLNVELALGDVTEDINILQNAAVMNIDSQGIENHMHVFFAGGSLSRMIVSGTGLFGVDENLQSSFNAGRQAIIDASTNTGGLDVTLDYHYNVKITGTTADDEIQSMGSGSGDAAGRVLISANNGANWIKTDGRYIADITSGTGNDTISSQNTDDVLVNAGDGANNVNVDGSRKINVTTGTGNDVIKANTAASTTASVTINAGAGNNSITANAVESGNTGFGTSTATITTLGGNDTITALLHKTVTVDAGDGNNTINVRASEINVTTGAGTDKVTIVGLNDTFDNGDDEGTSGGGGNNGWNDDNYGVNSHFSDDVAPGALLNIAMGAGTNTLTLGADRTVSNVVTQFGVTALEGSTLTGTGIKVFVENHSDITNLNITGATITSVVLKQELRIMLDQFVQIGAANFSVQFDEEGATEDLYIVVTEDTDMSAMLDALPASVRVHVELHNGATLTIDAEDLHTHFAWEGIDATDGLNGSIIINNAGLAFNPWSNGPNNQVIDGGTLSDSWSESMGVTINRSATGYNRPTEDSNVDITTIDTTGAATVTLIDPIVLGATGNPTVLEIIGNQDLVFASTSWIDLGDGSAMGNTVDFSALDGTVTGMVIMNFDNLTGGLFGNNTGTRVEVGLGGSLGSPEQGLISDGVETIVVTSLLDNDGDDFDTSGGSDGSTNTATIWLCDDSQGIDFIGMQGLYNKTLTINEVPWGLVHPTILLEGDGSVDWDDVLKANGSPETSNIGNIVVNYYIAGAPANILIRNEGGADLGMTSTAGERKFSVGSITVTNAISMNIDVEDGDARIADINGDSWLKTLDIDAVEDVVIAAPMPTTLTTIDVSGVTGSFLGSFAPGSDFTFEGAAGGSNLTILADFEATSATSIDGGVAGIDLVTADGTDVDLSDAVLTNVSSIAVGDGGELHLTIAQALEIGPENITTDGASLVLSGLGEEEFSLADFDEDFSISVEVDVIDQTTVTLHPNTDLTGIDTLLVPEGVTLVLTAAQFQQLTGAGAIQGVSGNDFSVVITGLDAASVVGGIDLSGITADNITVMVVEDVTLDDGDDLGGADLELTDGVTLSLYLDQADGLNISGANTVLKFLDTTTVGGVNHDSFDASGWSVSDVMLLNTAVADRNIDFLLAGIQEGVEKIIYNGVGMVDGVTQTVTINPETTVSGFVAFNPFEDGVEIENFVLNLEGGTEISGDLILATTDKEDGDGNDLIRTYLQTVVINSTGTAENIFSGATANVITGDVTPFGLHPAAIANEILGVTINATQDLVIEGEIIFESENGVDEFSGNDDDEAVAEVLVNGTADVTFGVDTTDGDVGGLNVVNAGTGVVTVHLDDDNIDDGDALSFTGGTVHLVIDGSIDLSDDDLSAVTHITMDWQAEVTLTVAQYIAIGPDNIVADDTDAPDEVINIVGLDDSPFDATGVSEGIVIGSVTMAEGDWVLNPATNLTGVTTLTVPEGGSVTMTAAQYQQLAGAGSIVGVGGSTDYTVHITGLTQDIVDDGFDITGITADTKTITLGEALVNLAADTMLGTTSELTFTLTAGQELGFENVGQVSPVLNDDTSVPGSGITINGPVTATATFNFATGIGPFDTIDASGINVGTLKLLNTLVDNQDVELLQNLGSDVTVVIFDPEENPGNVVGINRVVIIEEDVTVPGNLIFNDYLPGSEIRTLDITMEGGATIAGNLRLTTTDKDPELVQQFLDSLTINSEGDEVNTITGDIDPLVSVGNSIDGVSNEHNELLNVTANLTQDLVIGGQLNGGSVQFNNLHASTDATATITFNGTADFTAAHLETDDLSGGGIDELVLANNLTGGGTVTITGGSAAILDGDTLEVLTITGTGNTVLGVNPDVGSESSIDSDTLSAIDASASSGALTIGTMINVDSGTFEFTSGTGKTIVTMASDELNELVQADTGWEFDFSTAGVGSELHLMSNLTFTNGALTINMGANGTLYIDNHTPGTPQTVDLTAINLMFSGVNAIVLGDDVTLELTMDQADGLNIVAGDDEGGDGFDGVVNIVDVSDDDDVVGDNDAPVANVDLSGIAAEVAGTITFLTGDNDVTFADTTDLGFFSVTLEDIGLTNASLAGQTVRFSTEAQATREIIVNDAGGAGSSTNVVWLFDSIAAVGGIDTSDYSALLGRLWFYADLVDNEGGDVEQLFTTLPNAILRIDIESLAELNILLQSQAVNRVMEIVHFVTVGNLTFSDMGVDPEEHLQSLTLHVGGETTVGDIMVNDVVADPLNTDLSTIDFDFLTIVSHRAVRTGDLLASELFENDNDGTPEPIVGGTEHVQPDNINTVGNIGVGAGNSGIDLVLVNIDTQGITVMDLGGAGDGAAIDIGTITYGYTDQDGGGSDPATTGVTLDVTGDNDINIAAVVATDVDITSVTVSSVGFTAVLTAPGASPAIQLGTSVETLTFDNDLEATGTITLGSPTNAGVAGTELSMINADDFGGELNLGVISSLDGTGTDGVDVGSAVDSLDDDPAFVFDSGTGLTTLTIDAVVGQGTPTLVTGSTWVFDLSDAAAGSTVTIGDGAVIQDGAFLVFMNATVVIDGDVDLSDVNLVFDDGAGTPSEIWIPAGQELTLDVDQLDGSFVRIFGSGTLHLIGDASNDTAYAQWIEVVNVDLSALTIITDDLVVGNDTDDTLELDVSSLIAEDDDGNAAGYVITGSAFNDMIQGSTGNDSINGADGDDQLFGGNPFISIDEDTLVGGSGTNTLIDSNGNTLFVSNDAGVDTANGIFNDVNTGDIITVEAGASIDAEIENDLVPWDGVAGFVATAETTNAGTATLTLENTGDDGVINMALAGGPNGYIINGQDNDVAGVDTLIGSGFDDTLNGGNDNQADGSEDVLTGGAGDDTFQVNVIVNSAAVLTVGTTTAAIDREVIEITADDANDADETLTVTYSINGAVNAVAVSLGLIDSMSAAQVAAAVAAALDAQAGISATIGGTDDVIVAGDGGNSVEITMVTAGGTWNTLAGTPVEGTDQAQVTTLTVSGTPTIDDLYSIFASFIEGGGEISDFTATTTDPFDVADGLEAGFATAEINTDAAMGDGTIIFTDADADNGGFSLTTDTTAAFGGSGASDNGATDIESADIVTDFVSGTDVIDFTNLAGGVGLYAEAAAVANFAAAWAAADAVFDGTVMYYLTSISADDVGTTDVNEAGLGVLFFDANLDGNRDGMILLPGVSSASFTASDIITGA